MALVCAHSVAGFTYKCSSSCAAAPAARSGAGESLQWLRDESTATGATTTSHSYQHTPSATYAQKHVCANTHICCFIYGLGAHARTCTRPHSLTHRTAPKDGPIVLYCAEQTFPGPTVFSSAQNYSNASERNGAMLFKNAHAASENKDNCRRHTGGVSIALRPDQTRAHIRCDPNHADPATEPKTIIIIIINRLGSIRQST